MLDCRNLTEACNATHLDPVSDAVRANSTCEVQPGDEGLGLLWLLAGPMVVQFAVDSVTTAGRLVRLSYPSNIGSIDDLYSTAEQLGMVPTTCVACPTIRYQSMAILAGGVTAAANVISLIADDGQSFDPTCPNGMGFSIAVLQLLLWGAMQVSNPLKNMMQTFDGSTVTCFPRWRRPRFNVTTVECFPRWRRPRLFCNGGHIGSCIKFHKSSNGMERIYAVPLPATLAVGQLTKKMARTFFASMIPPALNVGLGLLVQELLPPSRFNNQGDVCSDNDLKTVYLPWVWLPALLTVLTVITKVACNSVLQPRGPLQHFLDLVIPDSSSEVDSADEQDHYEVDSANESDDSDDEGVQHVDALPYGPPVLEVDF